MSRITLPRAARRLPLAVAAATTAVLLAAVPAAAHVEVESPGAQALAENVRLTFVAESESATAGITELRVVLPKGIEPADVTYGEGPTGWSFTATTDGYSVKGPAVKAGEDVELSVVVRQLPDAKELAFKTLQMYGDGKVDRWIELGGSGDGHDHGHGNPAPVLKLKAAAPGARTVSPSPSAPASTSAAPTPTAEETPVDPSPQAADTAKEDDGGLSGGAWAGIAAAVLVAVAAAVFLVRRRGAAQE
ncbi:DUF1775 domain-containing protein [Streptomyces galilaeus]|uniref:DUF1775 domain-containing protein n=1 Tax=Streptomyces galilaeus TaxID=33899 RepID=UPI00123C7DC6|nr:DUF1775 domain-containing protein [Streptomyces galilaeus]QEU64092.1 DUF1775 domain-containing protein [Streptomyces galilaeus]GGW72172.1 hypothetical protein GCM10010350_66060 [Streptomyces galilaeus]